MLFQINIKNIIISFIILLVVIFLGMFIPGFVDIFSEKKAVLFVFPIMIIFVMLLVFARDFLFLMVLLCRSFLDPVFELTKLGGRNSGFGLGGVVNILVIGLAVFAIQKKPYPALDITSKVWGGFLLVVLLSMFLAPSFVGAIKFNFNIFSYIAIFAFPFTLIKSREDFIYWIKIILLSSIVPVLFGYYELVRHSPGIHSNAIEGFRIESTFGHPNIFAFYLVFMATLIYGAINTKMINLTQKMRRFLMAYIVIMLILLVFTKTRSAWVGCFVYFMFYGLCYDRRLLFFVLIVAPCMSLFVPEIRDRLMDINIGGEYLQYGRLDSYTWRKQLWQHSIEWMQPSRYLLGYGGNSFRYYSGLFGGLGMDAHSVFIQLIFETGFIGLLAFSWALVMIAYRVIRNYVIDRIVRFTILQLLLQYVMFSYSDNMLDYLLYNWYLWFVIGAALSLGLVEQNATRCTDSEVNIARQKKVIFLR